MTMQSCKYQIIKLFCCPILNAIRVYREHSKNGTEDSTSAAIFAAPQTGVLQKALQGMSTLANQTNRARDSEG